MSTEHDSDTDGATPAPDRGEPTGWWPRLLPVGLYSLLTLVLFYPASLRPGDYVMSSPFFFGELFNFFLVDHQLRADGSLVFATEMLNYPDGGYLVLIAWANILLYLALNTVVSMLASYNLSVMIMLVLGATGAYLLLRHLTGSFWAISPAARKTSIGDLRSSALRGFQAIRYHPAGRWCRCEDRLGVGSAGRLRTVQRPRPTSPRWPWTVRYLFTSPSAFKCLTMALAATPLPRML